MDCIHVTITRNAYAYCPRRAVDGCLCAEHAALADPDCDMCGGKGHYEGEPAGERPCLCLEDIALGVREVVA